jgi:branched-chain amino acid transport system permease protein
VSARASAAPAGSASGRRFRVRRSTRASTIALAVFLAAVVVLALSPFWGTVSTTNGLIRFCTLVCLAQMWNLLAGYAGLVSIGQQAYIGIGAYTMVYLGNEQGVNIYLCVALAGVVSLVLALPLAGAAFRLRGGYFAIGTWVLAEICRLIVANNDTVGGGTGTSLTAVAGLDPSTRQTITLWLAVAAGAGSILVVWLFLRSRLGTALTAVRDSEPAARALGVRVTRTKLAAYLVAAAGTGIAGAIIYLNLLRVEPSAAFSVNWTAYMIFIVVIGGIGTIEGPLIGAIIFYVLQEQLADQGSWYLIVLGVVAVAVTIRLPNGLWGWITDRWSVSVFPTGRRLEVEPERPPAPSTSA